MSKAKQSSDNDSNECEMVTAVVGLRYREENEVPKHIGEFTHTDTANDSTTAWKRYFKPTSETYPCVIIKYFISCTDSDVWCVKRAVETRERANYDYAMHSDGANSIDSQIQHFRTVIGGIETLERALELAERMMVTESKHDSLPNDVPNEIQKRYRKIEQGRF